MNRKALAVLAFVMGTTCVFLCGIYVDQGWWGLAAATGIGAVGGLVTCIVLVTGEK